MKKITLLTLFLSLFFITPAHADTPDLTFDYKKPYSTDTFKVKIYKKKMKSKSCNSYLSFDIRRKIGKGKKDPINETDQNLTLYFSYFDESRSDFMGQMFARMNFKWGNYKNNIVYKSIDGCSGKITREDIQKPIVIWLADTKPDGTFPTFILN